MKRFSIVLMTIVISAILVSCAFFTDIGNGDLVSVEKNVSLYEKVNVNDSAEVHFHTSTEYKIIVTADSNLIDNVETGVGNKTLSIGTKYGNYCFTKFLVDIYCPALTAISMAGSGKFIADETITVPAFESEISGSGKIEGIIDCETFSAKISGSGKINISGKSNDSNISISGSGIFNGFDFIMKNTVVSITGSGKADVHVTDYLKAIITGSGSVNYRGNPIVNSYITGSGKITKM